MSHLQRGLGATAALMALSAAAACGSFGSDTQAGVTPASDASSSPLEDASASASADAGAGDAAADSGTLKKLVVVGGQDPTAASKRTFIGTLDPSGIQWREGPPLEIGQQAGCAATIGGLVFLAGGRNDTGTSYPSAKALNLADPLAEWKPVSSPADPRQGQGCSSTATTLYVTGGGTNYSAAQKATTESAASDGAGGLTWTSGPALQTAIQDHASVVALGSVFTLGGYPCQAAVSSATIGAGGTLSAWGAAGALHEARYGIAAASSGDRIFVSGGLGGTSCSTATDAVDVLQVDASGKIIGNVGDRLLPDPRSYHGTIVVDGRLYVVGGNLGSVSPTPTRSVVSAAINGDDTLGPWKDETGLPIALSRFALTVY